MNNFLKKIFEKIFEYSICGRRIELLLLLHIRPVLRRLSYYSRIFFANNHRKIAEQMFLQRSMAARLDCGKLLLANY
jgi:hypothetical protein